MRTELPKRWYIIITEMNKSTIREWWNKNNYGPRSWSIGAHYGYNINDNNPISIDKFNKPPHAEEITFEEFERLVLNKSTEPQYEVY